MKKQLHFSKNTESLLEFSQRKVDVSRFGDHDLVVFAYDFLLESKLRTRR